jgi:hypothetical protein
MSSDNGNKINAVLVFDIIGKPKEYLVEALNKLVEAIDKENKVSVFKKKINEPVVMKDREDFYTSFAEVEIETEDIISLVILMFKYMPAHIEVVSPELIAISNNSWSDILSELTRRLHGYDELARVMQVEKGILEKKLRELLGQKSPEPEENSKKPKKQEKKAKTKTKSSKDKKKK